MTRDDIISIAREAGLGSALTHHEGELRVWIEGADWHDELERFAELFEAKVRKECAALCSATAAGRDAEAIEEAILARGEK
jgi:hypothetical protein